MCRSAPAPQFLFVYLLLLLGSRPPRPGLKHYDTSSIAPTFMVKNGYRKFGLARVTKNNGGDREKQGEQKLKGRKKSRGKDQAGRVKRKNRSALAEGGDGRG